MQLKAQPESSLSSKLEYLKQLVNAKTTKEIITVLNGGTNVKISKEVKTHEPCPYEMCDGSGTISYIMVDDLIEKDCLCKIKFEE